MKVNRDERFDLTGLDDETVEKLAAKYPVNDEDTKNRIMEKFLAKTGYDPGMYEDDSEPEITVSGTERYHRPLWSKYIGTAAALMLAFGSIFGLMKLNSGFGAPPEPAFATLPAATDCSTEPVTDDDMPEATDAAVTTEAVVFTAPAAVNEKETTAASTETDDTETTAYTDTTDTGETGTGTDTGTSAASTEHTTVETTPAEDDPENDRIREMLTGTWTATGEDGDVYEYTFTTYEDGFFGGIRTELSPENEMRLGNPYVVDVDGKHLMFHVFTATDNTPATISWEGTSLRDGFTLVWESDGSALKFTLSEETTD